MTIVFDIETDGLYYDVTTLHTIAIKINDGETGVYTSRPIKGSVGTLEEGLEVLKAHKRATLVGHNIIGYDLPVLKKLTGYTHEGEIHDTLIISKLKYTNLAMLDANKKLMPGKLKGSHSLKAWGYRLGNYKDEFEDWTKLSAEMVEYNRQDVEVNYSLYQRMLQRGLPPAEAIRLEQEFKKIITRQENYGWYFDIDKAKTLHVELLDEVDKAEDKLYEVFKPLKDWIPVKQVKEFNKDGSTSKVFLNQVAKGCIYNEDLEWGYYKEVVFNPGSRQHIARWLKEVYNWIPKDFTDKGSAIINEPVLEALTFPEGKILAHYFNVRKVIGMVAEGNNAWLKMVKDDHRIHGSVDTLGAVSRRCTHRAPNLAQVPSGRAYKGKECRELFTVPKGCKLVGCDADGLELRTLSHYMAKHDGGAYARAVDEGKKENGTDIHTLNKKGAGLPTRDDAKTFIYAFLYGAGDGKIGEIVGGSSKDGKRLKDKFFKQIPAIKSLVEGVQGAIEKGKGIKALDGNPYHIRSSHSALNTLLQGAGALVMKYWLIASDEALQKKYVAGIDYEFVGNIHDEAQVECGWVIAEDVAKILEEAFNTVTEQLKFRIPIRGTADIGDNWNDTH